MIFDDGFYDDAECDDRTYKNDPDSLFSIGGLYVSADQGSTWTRLNQAIGGTNMIPQTMRCDLEDDNYLYGNNHTSYIDFEVNPDDPNHYYVDITGRFSGLYEHSLNSDGTYSWKRLFNNSLDDVFYINSYCESGCIEGTSPTGLWDQNSPESNVKGDFGIGEVRCCLLYTSDAADES